MLNSDIFGRTLFGEIPTFEFMYIEKKIKENINKNENIFEKIKYINVEK
jgi:hypothetical protein